MATDPDQRQPSISLLVQIGQNHDMYKHEIFRNAPIREALVDIQVTLPEGTGMVSLEKFADAVSKRFPKKEDRYVYGGQIRLEQGTQPKLLEQSAEHVGYQFRSAQNDKVVQGRTNGFTFSKLKPYDKWENLRDEAQKLWILYCNAMKPESVVRLGMRYINRIEMPLPMEGFKQYIITGPEIAEGIPQGVSEHFMRLVIPDDQTGSVAIITSTIESVDPNASVLPYIFDIDVFKRVALAPDSGEIWKNFEQLRQYRNLIFFNSITDEARELFR